MHEVIEAIERWLARGEQVAVALGALRIVAFDVDDVAPADHRNPAE